MKPVLFIVGPTASGKSSIAIEVARRFRGEIISADSMLVYKSMDIGTAKPSKAEQRKVKHHLIDIYFPSKNFSAFEYRNLALKKIEDITKRGKLPVIAGGTGLYVRALLQGMLLQPGADPKLRRQLASRAKNEGLEILYGELKAKDPESAEKIKPTDERRIIRALEVLAAKKSGAVVKRQKSLKELGFQPIVIGITKERQALYADIEKRVDQMFRKGLLREVKGLAKKRPSATALQAVGYKEVLGALKGDHSLDEARALVKLRSRHLAKRQWTWFKREEGIQWVEWDSGDNAKGMASKVLAVSGLKNSNK